MKNDVAMTVILANKIEDILKKSINILAIVYYIKSSLIE